MKVFRGTGCFYKNSLLGAIRKLQGNALVSPAGSVGASADQRRQRSQLATRTLVEPTDIFARSIRESVIVGYTL